MLALELTPQDAFPLLHDPTYVWIDVREQEEWDYGHLHGIQHMPLSALRPDDFARFPKSQKIVLVCRSGGRSRSVTHALREWGYSHVQNLSGGMIGLNSMLEEKVPVLMH